MHFEFGWAWVVDGWAGCFFSNVDCASSNDDAASSFDVNHGWVHGMWDGMGVDSRLPYLR